MRKVRITALFLFIIILAASLTSCRSSYVCYLQDPEEIYIMEAGILRSQLEFTEGEDITLSYDFDNPEYPELISKYGIDRISGSGSEFKRALRLMDNYSHRLNHQSNYDNHIEMNALSLLEYSLDKPSHGINCRNKAQILNEMLLALGITARKVWIIPLSPYDTDCHVVNEVWDTELGKWVMLDITNNEYWIDENGTPLSLLEIRSKGALNEFCTPVYATESLSDPVALKEKHLGDFLYIMKNMVYLEYLDTYTVGENGNIYLLFPNNLETDYDKIISLASVEKAPF